MDIDSAAAVEQVSVHPLMFDHHLIEFMLQTNSQLLAHVRYLLVLPLHLTVLGDSNLSQPFCTGIFSSRLVCSQHSRRYCRKLT